VRVAPLLLLLATAGAAQAQAPEPEAGRPAAEAILRAVQEGLRGGAPRLGDLPEHPRPGDLAVLRGMLLLQAGRRAAAQRLIPEGGGWAAYRAMAEAEGPGGLGRARSVLARGAEAEGADPATLWLAALAFAQAGQPERADALLAQALRGASGALDPALAPTPVSGLVAAAQVALRGLLPPEEVAVRLAEAAAAAGARGVALELLRRPAGAGPWRVRGLRARLRALSGVAPEAARAAAQALLTAAPGDLEARLALADLALAEGDLAGARRRAGDLEAAEVEAPEGDPPPRSLKAWAARVRARLALADEDDAAAFRAAREAVLADPKDLEARALLARSLLLGGSVGQAAEVAEDLLKRRPTTVDPFAILAEVRAAQGRTREVAGLRLRSQGFKEARARQVGLQRQVERVFDAVRGAEGGVGVAGLTGLRAEDPRLGLPLDLALARGSAAGVARAARDRVLSACAPNLTELLSAAGGGAERATSVDLYGRPEPVVLSLSAADPLRCRGAALRVGGGQRPRGSGPITRP
jgi:hypothetical protein